MLLRLKSACVSPPALPSNPSISGKADVLVQVASCHTQENPRIPFYWFCSQLWRQTGRLPARERSDKICIRQNVVPSSVTPKGANWCWIIGCFLAWSNWFETWKSWLFVDHFGCGICCRICTAAGADSFCRHTKWRCPWPNMYTDSLCHCHIQQLLFMGGGLFRFYQFRGCSKETTLNRLLSISEYSFVASDFSWGFILSRKFVVFLEKSKCEALPKSPNTLWVRRSVSLGNR